MKYAKIKSLWCSPKGKKIKRSSIESDADADEVINRVLKGAYENKN